MIHAYDELYLDKSCTTLGRMLDFAVHELHRNADSFMELFISSGAAGRFARGDVRLIAGMSGVELAYEVLELSGLSAERIRFRYSKSQSGEYHAGRILARFQWENSASFGDILGCMKASEIISSYEAHRASILADLPWQMGQAERREAVAAADQDFDAECLAILGDRFLSRSSETKLCKLRKKNGFSQSQLAKASGVPLRTIQQYEQRQKDLRRAQFEYLVKLSVALNCDPLQLFE